MFSEVQHSSLADYWQSFKGRGCQQRAPVENYDMASRGLIYHVVCNSSDRQMRRSTPPTKPSTIERKLGRKHLELKRCLATNIVLRNGYQACDARMLRHQGCWSALMPPTVKFPDFAVVKKALSDKLARCRLLLQTEATCSIHGCKRWTNRSSSRKPMPDKTCQDGLAN